MATIKKLPLPKSKDSNSKEFQLWMESLKTNINNINTSLEATVTDIASALVAIVLLNLHKADTTIHFTEASINHTDIQNIGTNTHTQIDTHLANTSNPHSVTLAQVGGTLDHNALTNLTVGDVHTQYLLESGSIASITTRDHDLLNGLTDDDHSQYALLIGRTTPQTIALGNAASASTGYLTSTSNITKGKYFLNEAGTITVDELNTRLGIGTAIPVALLEIDNTILGNAAAVNIKSNSANRFNFYTASATASTGGVFQALRSRGTIASPTKIITGDTIFQINAQGYITADDYYTSGQILFIATEDGNVSSGGKITFKTTTNGSISSTVRLIIDQDGSIDLLTDAVILGFGADLDVTLTHVHNVGLLLNSSMQLQFGDSGTHIAQLTDGHLDLTADTSIDLNGLTVTQNLEAVTDDTYYLGKNSISTPKAYKGVCLKDTTNGNYYRIEVINSVITATQIV